MRYQEYKNKMMKVKKTLMSIHKLRFVVIGVTTVVVAGSITLDSIKGNITETTQFAISYRYGEKLSYSGSAVMSDVSFEFRKEGTSEWSEEEPKYVGKYEARAKSLSNHGYKYSEISKFEIKPIDTPIKIEPNRINFGDDQPKLSYSLLNDDRLDTEYKVTYADLSSNTTTASIDMNTLRVLDKDNLDVTYCYNFIPENENAKEITFNKAKIVVKFAQPESYSYTGEACHADTYDLVSGSLYYNAKLDVSGGISVSTIGTHSNSHVVKVLSQDGTIDYSANYDITISDNDIKITPANAIVVSSPSKTKTYDDKPFDDDVFTYTKTGNLLEGHSLKVTFLNDEIKDATTGVSNSMTVSVVDSDNHDVSNLYESVTTNPGTLVINKQNITIQSNSKNFDYDNLEKEETGFTYDDSELVSGHKINLLTNSKASGPDTVENNQTYNITRISDGADVTHNYNITKNSGDITFTKKPLKFEFNVQSIDYDGGTHNIFGNGNKATLAAGYEDNLPTGWTYDVSVDKTMRYYQENGFTADETEVTTYLYDSLGNDVTNKFNIDKTASTSNNSECDVTFDFPISRINKIDLNVTTADFGDRTFDDSYVKDFVTPSDLVTSSGLIPGDQLKVDFASSQTNSPNTTRDVGDYSFALSYKVLNSASVDVTSCYNWNYNGKQDSDVSIKKKDITIHTPNTYKIYDGTNVMPELSFDDGPNGEKINYDKTKTYTYQNASVNTYTYPFDINDIKISLSNRDVTNDYNINFVADGQIVVYQRNLTILQNEDTESYIYYDNEFHGVFGNTSAGTISNEVIVQPQQNNQGLLNSQYLIFNNERKTKDAGDEQYYQYAYPYYDNDEYYGTQIIDPVAGDVTSNYSISYSSNFHINIIKKNIYISQNAENTNKVKVFDGDPFDLNKDKMAGVYYDIDQFSSYYSVFILGFNSAYVELNEGHTLQATKTLQSVLDDSVNVGWYYNQFNCRVIDENNNDVSDYYNIYPSYSTLETMKLTVNAYCGNNNKEYNSQEFDAPIGTGLVTESTKTAYYTLPKSTAYAPFDKAAFLSNYCIKATFSSTSYPNYYMAGSYEFNASFFFCNSSGNPVSIPASNAEINTVVGSYKYDIYKIDIKITSKVLSPGKEMRYISYGKLATGDKLFFGSEEYDQVNGKRKLDWTSVCDYANIHIYRGGVDVTSCYNLQIV